VQNFLKIGSGVPELEDREKWHFPLKAFIALTTVLRYRADCDLCSNKTPALFSARFLHWSPILVYQFRPSARLSDTFLYCVKTAKHVVEIISLADSTIFLVLSELKAVTKVQLDNP